MGHRRCGAIEQAEICAAPADHRKPERAAVKGGQRQAHLGQPAETGAAEGAQRIVGEAPCHSLTVRRSIATLTSARPMQHGALPCKSLAPV